jgi:TatD DNase family protein
LFVDSHCHLDCIDLTEFGGSFDELLAKITDARVEHMLCVSIDLDKYPDMLEKVANYPQISVSVGVHPMADNSTLDSAYLKELAADKKVVAIGETGLDYYYHNGDRDWQKQRFRSHIQCAVETGKPVIVHTRDAGQDTLDILREERADKCRGVIHCFTETLEFAEQAMALGFMISFSGITTFNKADTLREIASHIPDDYLLIETDSPYIAPVPFRGKQNDPSMVKYIASTLADVRKTTVEHIAEVTRRNYYKMFGKMPGDNKKSL